MKSEFSHLTPVPRLLVLALCLLVCCTGCQLLSHKKPDTLLITGFEDTEEVVTFSDRDEIRSSDTAFRFSKVEGQSGQGGRIIFSVTSYGGFAVGMKSTDIRPFDTLSFWARHVDGRLPKVQLQFKNAEGARRKMSITIPLREAESDWTKIQVPLAPLAQFSPDSLANVVQMALIIQPGKGTLEFDEFRLENTGIESRTTHSKPPYPAKSEFPLPKGHGVWCYGNPSFSVDAFDAYKKTAGKNEQLRYIFPWAGSITFTETGSYRITWKPKRAERLAEDLETEALVLPMIDGLSHSAELLDEATWTRLAIELADLINDEPLFYGLHLDIEPHEDILYTLFSKIKAYTPKPLTVAVGQWSPDTFRYTDMVVLMGYDWAATPEDFAQTARSRIPRFLKDARKGEGKAMIGIPAIATHKEYESLASATDGAREPTGYEMADFVRGSLQATAGAQNASYVGLSVWALHSQEGLHGGRDTKWFYPTVISEEIWSMLRWPPKKWKKLK